MFKKNLLYSALALIIINPLPVSADTETVAPTSVNVTDKQVSTPSDTAITEQIKALYSKSPLIKDAPILIMTTNQNVTLSGNLQTDLQYEKAVTLARSVNGVADVNADNLSVKASQAPLTDTFITAKVKGVILKEKLFGEKDVEYWPIHVETKDGVVFITGNVDTEEQRHNILELVKGVQGVKSVNSTITIPSASGVTGATGTETNRSSAINDSDETHYDPNGNAGTDGTNGTTGTNEPNGIPVNAN